MSDLKTLEEKIKQYVFDVQGCKLIEICSNAEIVLISCDLDVDLITVINDLIKRDELVEVEYCLPPPLEYRLKSFILPEGSALE